MKTSKQYGPQFNASKYEADIINQIANRAVKMAADLGVKYDKMTATMDITACHCNGMPLALDKLLAADDGNFGHDIFGIRRFINRRDCSIGGCFVPRCSLPEHSVIS
jgi:hypothetical protein